MAAHIEKIPMTFLETYTSFHK